MRFFVDNCISPVLTEAIKILAEFYKYEIKHLSEKFPRDTKDPKWIPALADEGGWVIVSGDPRITRGKHERAAWLESEMTAFFLGDGFSSQLIWKQAPHLIAWWPEIVRYRERPKGRASSAATSSP